MGFRGWEKYFKDVSFLQVLGGLTFLIIFRVPGSLHRMHLDIAPPLCFIEIKKSHGGFC